MTKIVYMPVGYKTPKGFVITKKLQGRKDEVKCPQCEKTSERERYKITTDGIACPHCGYGRGKVIRGASLSKPVEGYITPKGFTVTKNLKGPKDEVQCPKCENVFERYRNKIKTDGIACPHCRHGKDPNDMHNTSFSHWLKHNKSTYISGVYFCNKKQMYYTMLMIHGEKCYLKVHDSLEKLKKTMKKAQSQAEKGTFFKWYPEFKADITKRKSPPTDDVTSVYSNSKMGFFHVRIINRKKDYYLGTFMANADEMYILDLDYEYGKRKNGSPYFAFEYVTETDYFEKRNPLLDIDMTRTTKSRTI